jgi:phage gp37-like protein
VHFDYHANRIRHYRQAHPGLGELVREVRSYSGELDGEPAEVVRQLPGLWVTFGGIQGTELLSTARNKWRDSGRFVVIAGTRSVRGDEASATAVRRKMKLALMRSSTPFVACWPVRIWVCRLIS